MEVKLMLLMISKVLFEKDLITIDEKELFDKKVEEN